MEFRLPELGEGVHEGELAKWKVKPGDDVAFDQPLCEIMTDKATVEIPSHFKGKVATIHAKEGEIVTVGQLMLSFEGAAKGTGAEASAGSASANGNGHAAKPAAAPAPAAAKPAAPAPSASKAPATSAPNESPRQASAMSASAGNTDPATRPLAAPATRRLAREMGVDLASVRGSGPHGRIMNEDLKQGGGASGGLSTPARSYPAGGVERGTFASEERVAFRGLRKKIAEKMRLSKDHATHFTYAEECDASELVKLRLAAKDIGAKQGVKVTYLPFIMKAMVAALRKYPILNSSLDEEKQELVYKHYFNIGLSIQTEDGLTAPVVKDVEHKTIMELARDIQALVDRARAKKLTQDDFHGSTITLTNAGSIGGLFATPIINYPEVAILGFNKIARKPVVVTEGGPGALVERVAIRDYTIFSISLDHRVVDGAVGAEFMKLFISYVENPALLLMESF